MFKVNGVYHIECLGHSVDVLCMMDEAQCVRRMSMSDL